MASLLETTVLDKELRVYGFEFTLNYPSFQ